MDGFGIVYLFENAQQFWSELEDILKVPGNASLSLLDATLKRSIAFCASYHEQYLQSPLQLEHACEFILESELFTFHSERMCEILSDEAVENTDPHIQFMLYSILLYYGRCNPNFLRSLKRWQPLVPLLIDHILVDADSDIEETFSASVSISGPSTGWKGLAIPIEARLRSLSVRLLYEVCRSSKLSIGDLKVFDDNFLDKLFDLVEQTRSMQDETFNYSVIKLIIALNEQFMVAEFTAKPQNDITNGTSSQSQNRVLHVLIRRHGTSQTFGENLIFMLNRAGRTPEDLVMQLLVLKILYILFNTKGLSEYFYTNDLCVLVDVFLREIIDLDEEAESLRHTFLRVLHPLLTKTQLRSLPYKRPQIVRALESLIAHQEIREVNPTTKRLVERCLSGEWCVQHRTLNTLSRVPGDPGLQRTGSPSSDRVATQSLTPKLPSAPAPPTPGPSVLRRRSIKGSRSAENLRGSATISVKPASRGLEVLCKPANDSALNLAGVQQSTAAAAHHYAYQNRDRTSPELSGDRRSADQNVHPHSPGPHSVNPPIRHNSLGTMVYDPASLLSPSSGAAALPPSSPLSPVSVRSSDVRVPPSPARIGAGNLSTAGGTKKVQRRPPPAPPKRRKPPAVPVRVIGTSNSGAQITAIASSTSAPTLGKIEKT
ncbi:hypothetical protein B0F90DRAFT_1632724 [Multifurca ochricompacta]|uniref:SPIN90/Ldb17 leucine-rich domain-containing protein n=1 Tax=Multifurca ochricompacta TaxID=376703 RepID=A0AAD4M2T3_9AGAM|nr:hypothetical protein B0F90DRAFT_1632724 [Multifurca ochricompacta]